MKCWYLGKHWEIKSDDLNVTLFKLMTVRADTKTKKKGDTYWVVNSYHSSPGNALKALLNLEVKATGMSDLKVVVDRIEKVEAMIEKALKDK